MDDHAGIGRSTAETRRRIAESCARLEIELDPDANARRGPRIAGAGSRVSAGVVPADKELVIARHAGRLPGLVPARA